LQPGQRPGSTPIRSPCRSCAVSGVRVDLAAGART
jgi:hypothetical protein